MAAKKLKQIATAVNQPARLDQQPAAGSETAAAPNLVALSAAVWEAVGRVAEKENRRDDIPDGFSGRVELSLAAKIQGQIYRQQFTADLTVGYGSQAATSSLPNVGAIVGHILARLNAATREAILRELPAAYAAAGGKLEVTAEIEAAAEGLLSKLRATKQIAKRGPVSCKYQPAAPSLSLVLAD
jgi:hypothetical protein